MQRMTASENRLREVKGSEKLGGLRKNVGRLGFAGLAKLSRQIASSGVAGTESATPQDCIASGASLSLCPSHPPR
jgi:hypothetical protein